MSSSRLVLIIILPKGIGGHRLALSEGSGRGGSPCPHATAGPAKPGSYWELMTSSTDVQPIIEEIQRRAAERRRQLAGGQMATNQPSFSEGGEEGVLLAASYRVQANLLYPVLVLMSGISGWFARIMRPLRRKLLLPFLSRQTTFNQAVIQSFEAASSRLQSSSEELGA